MKARTIPQSGKHGQIVAFKSRFIQCERQHLPLAKRRTAAQRRAQSDFWEASLAWNDITDEWIARFPVNWFAVEIWCRDLLAMRLGFDINNRDGQQRADA
jgi:hypothetical protein